MLEINWLESICLIIVCAILGSLFLFIIAACILSKECDEKMYQYLKDKRR